MEPTGGNSFDVFGGYTKNAVYMFILAHLHSCPSPFAQKDWLSAHMPSLCTVYVQNKTRGYC